MPKKNMEAIKRANDYSAKRRAYRKAVEEEEAGWKITAPVVVGKGRYSGGDEEEDPHRRGTDDPRKAVKLSAMDEVEFRREMNRPWKRED